MVEVSAVLRFCPNFEQLSPVEQGKILERLYRKQLIGRWGFHRGDSRLRSSGLIPRD